MIQEQAMLPPGANGRVLIPKLLSEPALQYVSDEYRSIIARIVAEESDVQARVHIVAIRKQMLLEIVSDVYSLKPGDGIADNGLIVRAYHSEEGC